jgi:hypothetical protein
LPINITLFNPSDMTASEVRTIRHLSRKGWPVNHEHRIVPARSRLRASGQFPQHACGQYLSVIDGFQNGNGDSRAPRRLGGALLPAGREDRVILSRIECRPA